MYLVIKNGDTKKSYQCTNTCNKPRVRVGSSYIPLTNNIQSKPKCKINSMEIASYKSYTYTTDKGTVTTGTTYLTRASTSNTIYGTITYTVNSTAAGSYTFTGNITKTDVHYDAASTGNSNYCAWEVPTKIAPQLNNIAGQDRFTHSSFTYSYAGYGSCSVWIQNFVETKSRSSTDKGDRWRVSLTYMSGYGTYVISPATITKTNTQTTGTTYKTRASTSGTSYGTKTTNKTLTSSSWG